MSYDPDTDHRRSLRLATYDYISADAYFVTICTYQRECWLAEVMDGVSAQTVLGRVAEDAWRRRPVHVPRVELDEFVVMPNHVHGLLVIADQDKSRPASGMAPGDQGEAFAGTGVRHRGVVLANASPSPDPPAARTP
jgi:hypothetical protein